MVHSNKLFVYIAYLLCIFNANAFAAETTRISVGSNGVQANGFSYRPSLSSNGRYVAFISDATNLVVGDTNQTDDTFVYDRVTKETTRVSVDSNGNQQVGFSSNPAVSADGGVVAYVSEAPNLVLGDTNNAYDIFIHDRQSKQTNRVSVGSGDVQANASSNNPALSADGRIVAFESEANNLVDGDNNMNSDIFVYDAQSKQTTRVSVDSSGAEGNGSSNNPVLSADGRYVAFMSSAVNLVPEDTNDSIDIFVHDRQTKQTTRVSVDSKGMQENGSSFNLSLSADGRIVAFESTADNLSAGDANKASDIFVHDRQTKLTTRASVGSNGVLGNNGSESPRLSANGRYVLFESLADNLVTGDTNTQKDIFVHDRIKQQTTRVSVDSNGIQANDLSLIGNISGDGNILAYESFADNLVAGDTNAKPDIFVHSLVLDTKPYADLQITATKKSNASAHHGKVAYLFTITNNGPASIENVSLKYLISGGRVVRLKPSQGHCLQLDCQMGSLPAGTSATLVVVAKARWNPLVQQVSVNGNIEDTEPSNNNVSVSTRVRKHGSRR